VSKEEENMIRELDSLRKELEKVKKSADAAQGEFIVSLKKKSMANAPHSSLCQRRREERRRITCL
jgi:hypothetical protein